MKLAQNSIRVLLMAAAVASFAACTTEKEVVVVHQPRHVHHTGTAPTDFGVVNQYDHR